MGQGHLLPPTPALPAYGFMSLSPSNHSLSLPELVQSQKMAQAVLRGCHLKATVTNQARMVQLNQGLQLSSGMAVLLSEQPSQPLAGDRLLRNKVTQRRAGPKGPSYWSKG